MEYARSSQPAAVLRKGKMKQAKDELDRQKQAEKKKRRIEKALATSAAIRSELEKKKQKKLEELKRLDEEGAAVAEAVALHVLLGEDTDESRQIMLNGSKYYNSSNQSGNVRFFTGCPNLNRFGSGREMGWTSDVNRPPLGVHVGILDLAYYDKRSQGADVCPGLIAQAVSALHITD